MRSKKGFEMYTELNPDRLLGIVHLYICLSRYECKGPHVEKSYSLQHSLHILEHLLTSVPGLVAAHLMLARVLIHLDDFEAAHQPLQSVLVLDPANASAQLLLAKVCLPKY
jgi:hypothetical protein